MIFMEMNNLKKLIMHMYEHNEEHDVELYDIERGLRHEGFEEAAHMVSQARDEFKKGNALLTASKSREPSPRKTSISGCSCLIACSIFLVYP